MMNEKTVKDELLKEIFLSLFDENLNGWELNFLEDIRDKISNKEKILLSDNQLKSLEDIFFKTGVYAEDIVNLSYDEINDIDDFYKESG